MKIVFLQGAEEDLKELRRYIVDAFGLRAWAKIYADIKQSVRSLQQFPYRGAVPDELADLDIDRFRQLISGENRIVYEIADEKIFIHIVCDSRRDMKSMLARRLSAISAPRTY